MRILLIEDEKRMAEALKGLLEAESYEVDVRTEGDRGLEAVLTDLYDIVILDVTLPGLSGFEVAKEARDAGIQTPILMLTAKSGLDDKVTGLDSGADDYLTKPFLSRELLARLRALVRRSRNEEEAEPRFGDIALNAGERTLLKTDTEPPASVRLSEKEFRVMEYLILNQDRSLPRELLARRVWGYDNEAEYNNVEVYLSFLRRKLSFVGSSVEIKATRGLGYELRSRHV